MSKRKPHNHRPGYVAMRNNPLSGGFLTLYATEKAGFNGDGKYVVHCDKHHSAKGFDSLAIARIALKYPDFCPPCVKRMQKEKHPL